MPADVTSKMPKIILNNRYTLGRQLGVGGMGTVYEAFDRLTGDIVALKHVHAISKRRVDDANSDDGNDTRIALSTEFRTLASLRHPNIITVIDYGFDENQLPYFTMNLLTNTKNVVVAGSERTSEGKVKLLNQLLQALAYLHRRDIIHRDLKPGNVLVTQDDVVKVLDFGVALNENRTMSDQKEVTVGTLSYMSPELFLEQPASIESDLYAVGVMAYQMFAGKHPFNAQNMASLVSSVMRDQPDLSLLDPQVSHVIARLLAKPVSERYHTAEAVIYDLNHALKLRQTSENIAIRESYLQASRFVGRDNELNTLRDALQNVYEGDSPGGSAWLIGGESGVGKSRLVEELRVRALVRGMQVLRAQCIADSSLPYHAWQEPLRRLALSTHFEAEDIRIIQTIIPDLDELLDQPPEILTSLEGIDVTTRLIETIEQLFRKLTHPTLLIMEDLHWADESLTVLRAIIKRVDEMPLMIIGTYRDDERAELPDLLPEASPIHLGRLADSAIAELSESILGEAGRQPAILNMIKRETEGNVFFIVEVIRALAERAGSLSKINPAAVPQSVLSGGIQQVIQERLRHVPQEAQALLKHAAIIGRQIDTDLLNTLYPIETSPLSVDLWLTICANAAVLEADDGRWRFVHDKLREGVLVNIANDERIRLYRQVAEATEAVYGDAPNKVAALADYWHEAKEPAKELHYVRLAIDQTSRINAFKETIHFIERAIELLRIHNIDADWQHQAADLKIQMGEAYSYLGAFDEARKHLNESADLSRKLGNRHTVARALNALGDIDQDQGEYDSAIRNHKISLTLFRETNDQRGVTNALTDLGKTAQSKGEYDEAHNYYEEALRLCRQTNDFEGIVDSLEYLGNVSEQQGKLDDANHYYEESLGLIREMGNFSRVAGMLDNLGNVAQRKRDYPAAQIYYNESLAIYRRINNELGAALVLGNLGTIALVQQHLMTAQTYCEESLSIFRKIDNRLGIAFSLNNLGNVAMYQQDVKSARAHYREALTICQEAHIRGGIASGYNHLGWVEEVEDNERGAIDCYNKALALFREMGDREKIAQTLTSVCFVKLRQGKLDEARNLLRESLDGAWRIGALQTSLAVITGFAQLAYMQRQYKHSAELMGVVSQEIDMDDATVERRLEPLLKHLEANMDADTLLGALEYGRVSLSLEAVVDDLLHAP